LLFVLDEVETLQRVRGDVREKSLNALRQLIDEVDSGSFPGLYVLITGTGRLLRRAAGRAAPAAAGAAAPRRLLRGAEASTTRVLRRCGCRGSS
jgi:hypothetical protein